MYIYKYIYIYIHTHIYTFADVYNVLCQRSKCYSLACSILAAYSVKKTMEGFEIQRVMRLPTHREPVTCLIHISGNFFSFIFHFTCYVNLELSLYGYSLLNCNCQFFEVQAG